MIKVSKIDSASAIIPKANPTTLLIKAVSILGTGGKRISILEPRIYINPPKDGIWEFDFFVDRQLASPSDELTHCTATYEWIEYDPEYVKGVRILGDSEPKVIMLN